MKHRRMLLLVLALLAIAESQRICDSDGNTFFASCRGTPVCPRGTVAGRRWVEGVCAGGGEDDCVMCEPRSRPSVRDVNCVQGEWSACSKDCGGGVRTRTIQVEATGNGEACGPPFEACNEQVCDVIDLMWRQCCAQSSKFTHGYMGNNGHCDGGMDEMGNRIRQCRHMDDPWGDAGCRAACNECASCDVPTQDTHYFLGASGTNNCGDNLTVSTEGDCRAAAANLVGTTFATVFSSSTRPKGCFGAGNGALYFNLHETGAGYLGGKPVCHVSEACPAWQHATSTGNMSDGCSYTCEAHFEKNSDDNACVPVACPAWQHATSTGNMSDGCSYTCETNFQKNSNNSACVPLVRSTRATQICDSDNTPLSRQYTRPGCHGEPRCPSGTRVGNRWNRGSFGNRGCDLFTEDNCVLCIPTSSGRPVPTAKCEKPDGTPVPNEPAEGWTNDSCMSEDSGAIFTIGVQGAAEADDDTVTLDYAEGEYLADDLHYAAKADDATFTLDDCDVKTCDCIHVGIHTTVNHQYLCQKETVCYNLVEDWCGTDEDVCEIPV